MPKILVKFKKGIQKFIKGDRASEAIEMAVLFPILLLMVGFIIDQFITYEAVTSITVAANEAIRVAVVEDTEEDGLEQAKERLNATLKASKLGWCTGTTNDGCGSWKDHINQTEDADTFDTDKNTNLLWKVETGWCDGGYVTLGVRAHKSSLFPAFKSFSQLSNRGTIFHVHSYVITARVESNEDCS